MLRSRGRRWWRSQDQERDAAVERTALVCRKKSVPWWDFLGEEVEGGVVGGGFVGAGP